jgi:hypothetical protein
MAKDKEVTVYIAIYDASTPPGVSSMPPSTGEEHLVGT